MQTKTEGIVLRSVQYGDKSFIVQFYTKNMGAVSYLSKGVSRRAAMRPVLMQPFSVVELVANSQPSKQLNFLKETKSLFPLQTIPYNVAKSAVAMFLSEFLSQVLHEPNADEALYDFIRQSIEFFDGASEGFANFHLVFLLKLSDFFGFFPNLSHFDKGVYFDLQEGTFCKNHPLHDCLEPPEAEAFAQLMRMDYRNMHVFKLSRTQRMEILNEILHFYRLHLPSFGELKSLKVVSELFE